MLRPHRPRLQRGLFIHGRTYLRATLGQPLRLHPASVLAGLAAGADPAASPCSSPRRQAAWLPEASRVKASPGILTRSLRCASGCGFRSRPWHLFRPNGVS